jgi:hypothetical protein
MRKLVDPLLSEARWGEHEHPCCGAACSQFGDDERGLHGLAESHFVGDENPRASSVDDRQGRLELMGQEVHARGPSGAKDACWSGIRDQLTTRSPPPGRANDSKASVRDKRFDSVERCQNLLLASEVSGPSPECYGRVSSCAYLGHPHR